jgi:hypothetical protein
MITETIEYKSYKINIATDETPENPFTCWEGGGAARAIKNEHPDTDTKNLNVTRIETAIFAR